MFGFTTFPKVIVWFATSVVWYTYCYAVCSSPTRKLVTLVNRSQAYMHASLIIIIIIIIII